MSFAAKNKVPPVIRRRQISKGFLTCFLGLAMPVTTQAHDVRAGASGLKRQVELQAPLPDFPDRIVTALTIELAPGAVVGPHRHGGFVYVYLLEGRIRSQMEGEDPVDYVAGQSWIEPAEALHQRTENPSRTEPARFLAVVYSAVDAVITQPEKEKQ